MNKRTSLVGTLVAVLAALVLNWAGLLPLSERGVTTPAPTATAPGPASPAPAATAARGEIAWSALPSEAHGVIRLIRDGGPFRYDKDGTVFQNRERLLPERDRGYYREYTVETPGEATRGARRIVAGGPRQQPEVLYYTGDHYRSFQRIREDRR
ncbi:MAG: ribonuclease domain-containing protein [Burkholderiaceae bacterium]